MSDHASSPRRRILIIAAMIAAALLATIAGAYLFRVPSPAPEVTFISLSGEKITSNSLRGKVVIVNFWATNCTVCIREMPKMVETYQRYKKQGLEFVAVAMHYDAPNYVIDYAETRQLPFTVTFDFQGKLAKAFGGIDATPTTFVIDRQGNIIERYVGEPDFPELHQLLEDTLKT